MRLSVELDLSKSLVGGFPIPKLYFSVIWVQFKYEKLVNFCYLCGRIRYVINLCLKNEASKEDFIFGPHMQTESVNTADLQSLMW